MYELDVWGYASKNVLKYFVGTISLEIHARILWAWSLRKVTKVLWNANKKEEHVLGRHAIISWGRCLWKWKIIFKVLDVLENAKILRVRSLRKNEQVFHGHDHFGEAWKKTFKCSIVLWNANKDFKISISLEIQACILWAWSYWKAQEKI